MLDRTFLFTDIEGSTRLWEEQPETMRLALVRHDALLRAAIETNGGVVFKTIGDAFCAAFSCAATSARVSFTTVRCGTSDSGRRAAGGRTSRGAAGSPQVGVTLSVAT